MPSAVPAGVEIRIATPADGAALVAAIAAIDVETPFLGAPDEPLAWTAAPEAMLRDLAERRDGVYVIAHSDDAIVGYAGAFAGQYRSTRGVLSIPHIGVRQTARRQGIAARLLDALEAWGRRQGAHRVDLTVDETNAAARALYRAAGFVEEGRVRDGAHDADGWRAYIAMAKRLDAGSTQALPPDPAPRVPRADSLTIEFRTLV